MEGCLCVPPERSALLGKAGWKARYVVLGPNPRTVPSSQGGSSSKPSRHKSTKTGKNAPKGPSRGPSFSYESCDMYLTIYRKRGDRDFVSTHSINKIQRCTIESAPQGKSSESCQILNITTEPERRAAKREKARIGRSGMPETQKSRPAILTFRDSPNETSPRVFEWYQTIQTYRSELDSRTSTGSWGMIGDDERPTTSNTNRSSSKNRTHSRALLSTGREAGSMRSTPSAASSRPSSNNRRNGGRTPDVFASSEDQTPANRPHILEHIQAVSSVPPSSKPLPPPESILDRAFTLNYIPYTSSLDSDSEGELEHSSQGKGSKKHRSPSPQRTDQPQTSIARIEALMRRTSLTQPHNISPKLYLADPRPPTLNPPDPIPSPTQRAIDFISSRAPPAIAVTPTKGSSASRGYRRSGRPSPPIYPRVPPSAASRIDDEPHTDWRRLSIISAASSSGYSHAVPSSQALPVGTGAGCRTTALQDLTKRLSSPSSLVLAHARDGSRGSGEMISLDGSESLSFNSGWDLDHSARETNAGCLSARPVQVPIWGTVRGTVPTSGF
ncbi:MAG: hypothetical protein M1814_001600 [Vezdaea aestivalis]|nr:MAG: hypothetical protein M1814_001600 [Vezdaea aestivalis]